MSPSFYMNLTATLAALSRPPPSEPDRHAIVMPVAGHLWRRTAVAGASDVKRLRILPVVLLMLLAGCIVGDDNDVQIDGGAAGTTVALDAGQTLRVELEGNPTTGYEWEVSAVNEAILRYVDSDFDPDSDATGSGGTVTLTFEAVGAGATLLELIERPSWEPPSDSHQRFSVTVRVT
jgi:inhibitor of cysteine peptidase